MAFLVITHPDIERAGVVSEGAWRFYQAKGWRLAAAQPLVAAAAAAADVPMPQRNDKTEEWRTYAKSLGMPAEQAASMSRDELVAYYTAPTDQTEES